MVREIRSLLYEQGFTIGGARQQLGPSTKTKIPVNANNSKDIIRQLRGDLEKLASLLKGWGC